MALLHGTHVPHRKHTHDKPVARLDTPETVLIPMLMHRGSPALPLVKAGDTVKVGQKIAEADGIVSSPIYASVSGTVKSVAEILTHTGVKVPAVLIASDGEMSPAESICPPDITDRDSLIKAVKESGVVGLGGSGFPTHIKLNVEPGRIRYLILNGAECEPYITSDTVTMTQRAEDMATALTLICRYLEIPTVVIGVEKNKPTAIASMQKLANELPQCHITVKVLPTLYPQGGEKVIIYHTTGQVTPKDTLPIDVGCAVLNVTTVATLGRYFQTGMPLVEKCITVDGGAVTNPQNVLVPIGTSFRDVLAFTGLSDTPAKLLYGGPMMGITVPDDDAPVMKNTNAILALTENECKLPSPTPCIRCGACTNVCPFGLAPAAMARALEKKDADALDKLHTTVCMECGCCSYVCPANRPLVQTNRMAKTFLAEEKEKEAQTND